METVKADRDHPNFFELAREQKRRARLSLGVGYLYLALIFILIGITIFFWMMSRNIAARDIEKSKKVAQESAGYRIEFHGVASSGKTTVAVGERGVILVSMDSKDWKEARTDTRNDFYDVALNAEGSAAIAVGEKGLFRSSDDGGETWENPGNFTRQDVNGVALSSNGRTAIAVGENNLIKVLVRDGKKWKEGGNWNSNQNAWTRNGGEKSDDFEAAAFASEGRGVVVGDNGAILLSDKPAGSSGFWEPKLDTKGRDDFLDVASSRNGEILVAVGRRGIIWGSTDGGERWESRQSKQGNDIEAVALSEDGGVAIAVGRDGTVLVSKDNGKNWTVRNSKTANWLYGVTLNAGKTTAMIVGDETFLQVQHSVDQTFSEIEDVQTRISNTREQQNSSANPPPRSKISLTTTLQINFLRIGVTIPLMFMVQYLIGLIRYKVRLAAFYYARHDAILLTPREEFPQPKNIDELEQLMHALSPDGLDIGRPSKIMSDRIMRMIDRFMAYSESRQKRRLNRPGSDRHPDG